jgi:hypothetical protein
MSAKNVLLRFDDVQTIVRGALHDLETGKDATQNLTDFMSR